VLSVKEAAEELGTRLHACRSGGGGAEELEAIVEDVRKRTV